MSRSWPNLLLPCSMFHTKPLPLEPLQPCQVLSASVPLLLIVSPRRVFFYPILKPGITTATNPYTLRASSMGKRILYHSLYFPNFYSLTGFLFSFCFKVIYCETNETMDLFCNLGPHLSAHCFTQHAPSASVRAHQPPLFSRGSSDIPEMDPSGNSSC